MSYFGTDGIRGKFGQMPITPEFALKLGFAAGKVLKRTSPKNKPLVVLGKDTRLSGYILESALQAGLNAAGVYVHLLGPLPTPSIKLPNLSTITTRSASPSKAIPKSAPCSTTAFCKLSG